MIKHLRQLSVEELANTLTHGAGLVLSIGGFVPLALLAVFYGNKWHIASSLIYGASLIILYGASTVYHVTLKPERKRVLQIVDHCCIFLLIAGSYTPFLMIAMRTGFGLTLLAVVWILALAGITLKLFFGRRLKAIGFALYILTGWLGLIALQPLYLALGLVPLVLVVAGGISYTAGTVFFGLERIRHHHAIFHVFVLAGSIIHYSAILIYLVPHNSLS